MASNALVNKYVSKIVAGEMTFLEVPALWSKKVKKALEDAGYVINEDGTVSLPEVEDEETVEEPTEEEPTTEEETPAEETETKKK